VRLLEAYFDRTFGADWREREAPRARSSTMSRAEALKVLGLEEGATEEEIRAAHKKLMLQNHPDRGGSDYLASKINEAKDTLLGS
jgi:DnaJ-class molecular chaperone